MLYVRKIKRHQLNRIILFACRSKVSKDTREIMIISTILKPFIRSIFPLRILQIIKKIYYVRLLKSFSEENIINFKIIKQLISPGDYVVDIGSNIGVYTKYLSELVGVQGCVYSIEPISHTFEILCSNVRKLKLRNVVLINYAISDKDSTVTMGIPSYKSGGENYYRARIVHGDTNKLLRREKVKSRTIDTLLAGLPYDISFLKCDVEGHELQCIKGAIKVLEKSKPACFIEITGNPDDPKSTASEVFKLLKEKGYEAYYFDGKNLEKRRKGDKSINYFFLKSAHLRLLQGQDCLK